MKRKGSIKCNRFFGGERGFDWMVRRREGKLECRDEGDSRKGRVRKDVARAPIVEDQIQFLITFFWLKTVKHHRRSV